MVPVVLFHGFVGAAALVTCQVIFATAEVVARTTPPCKTETFHHHPPTTTILQTWFTLPAVGDIDTSRSQVLPSDFLCKFDAARAVYDQEKDKISLKFLRLLLGFTFPENWIHLTIV